MTESKEQQLETVDESSVPEDSVKDDSIKDGSIKDASVKEPSETNLLEKPDKPLEVAEKRWARATFMAQEQLAQDNFVEAREHYIDALNAILPVKNSMEVVYAQTQVAYACVCVLTGDAECALYFLVDEVLPIYDQHMAQDDVRMLELYHLIANVFHVCGLLEEAKPWYEFTLDNMEPLGADNVDKQVVIANYSKLLLEYRAAA